MNYIITFTILLSPTNANLRSHLLWKKVLKLIGYFFITHNVRKKTYFYIPTYLQSLKSSLCIQTRPISYGNHNSSLEIFRFPNSACCKFCETLSNFTMVPKDDVMTPCQVSLFQNLFAFSRIKKSISSVFEVDPWHPNVYESSSFLG